MSVVLEAEGEQKKIMDNVTRLEVLKDGVRISTLFEAPREIVSARLQSIDFLNGTVTLVHDKGGE
ncbi:MAG: CooT family nickel-binding protein [Desulfobulbaceae bacterium]|nr:CooT family nickel-binding protein [Desulfobulbaceae bacterium]